MSSPKDGPGPHPVDDPEAAFRRFENFTRRLLSVPKKQIDQKLAEEKAAKKRAKPR